MEVLKWFFALTGHVGICCVAFNKIHASAVPRGTRKTTEKFIAAVAIIPLLLFLWRAVIAGVGNVSDYAPLLWLYLYGAALFGLFLTCRWLVRKFTTQTPTGVNLLTHETIDVSKIHSGNILSGAKANLFGSLPLNQISKLKIEHWELGLKNLPQELDGLKIVQFSDLHLTGMILPEYFDTIVERANAFEPDLVFVTGDIVDERECMKWLKPIFSKLESKYGIYYVLGNHDILVRDESGLRKALKDAGLLWAADGQWHELKINNSKLLLTGNAIPWFKHCKDLPVADDPQAFKILLSHSPDQLKWALERGVDLMFGGHTHGGQVQLPFIGPVIAPSAYGVKYASGNFRFGKMLMHISRGLSGDEPIRFFCPPELGCFTLRASGQDS